MAKVTVEMNSAGAITLMNSSEVQSLLLQKAQSIANSASSKSGGQYSADVRAGKTRAHARATTADRHARNMEFNYNTLLKSIGAGKQ